MTTAPISLQDLQRRIYAKAKAEPSWRFWGLYVHVGKLETLRTAYAAAKANNGAPGSTGSRSRPSKPAVSRAFSSSSGTNWSPARTRPLRCRRKEIPKEGSRKVASSLLARI